MKQLPVGHGIFAMVDDQDFDHLSELTWHRMPDGYPRTKIPKWLGGGPFVMLHRYIMGAEKGDVIDHIDGDRLNCQRDNLQFITQSRNVMKGGRASSFRGVFRSRNRWYARIKVDKRLIYVGSFASEDEAVAAVQRAREAAWTEHNPHGYQRGV